MFTRQSYHATVKLSVFCFKILCKKRNEAQTKIVVPGAGFEPATSGQGRVALLFSRL